MIGRISERRCHALCHLELLRWLSSEAELIEPKAWRAAMREELARILACYDDLPHR